MSGVVVAAVVIGGLVLAAGPRTPPPLPGYTLTITGNPLPPSVDYPGLEPLAFNPGGQVTITARPTEPVRGKLDVVAALSVPDRAGGSYYPRSAEVARDGTVTISGTTDWVFDGVEPGTYQLLITLQRPGRFADEPGGTVELRQKVAWRSSEVP